MATKTHDKAAMTFQFFKSPLFVAVLAAFLGALFAIHEDHIKRQDEARVAYLIDAYDNLALAGNRLLDHKNSERLEIAVEKVQLFGTPEEIGLLHAFLDEWHRTELLGQPKASLDPLLKALRNRLRAELSLPPIPSELESIGWIRPEGGVQ